ncbi:ABC transporter substrate binding protein [Vibrio sp. MACH09]|uniref:ABC transporter substrate binding protein n=1 Tax=Vibrio sp. MACH09 TaxID=3025122 RepID=UPI00295E2140|nr:ABC transporter substrate binding protein [Vibrio sp. MACH09]
MRFFVMTLILVWSSVLFAEEKDVLVIQSYHQGYAWSDQFQSGLSEVLERNNIVNRVVYLDTKRHQSEAYLQQLIQLYQQKFQRERFRAIVAVDNTALNLVNRLASYIKDTPVIFSGINGYSPSMHANLNATGVVSKVEVAGNIGLIQRLQPKVEKIYIISGQSVTGSGVRASIEKYLANNPHEDSLVEHFVPESFQQLVQFTSHLPSNSAVLFWNFYLDQSAFRNEEKVWKVMDEIASVPVYVFHDSVLGEGAVGGVVHNSLSQGRSTGELVVDALGSEQGSLPNVRYATPATVLDYQALMHWGLNIEDNNAVTLINKPDSMSKQVQLVLILFAIMFAVIVVLLYYLRRIAMSEASARRSQMLIESVLEKSQQYIAILGEDGRVISSNHKLHDLLFERGAELEPPIWHFTAWQNNGKEAFKQFFADEMSSSTRFELEALCKRSGNVLLDVVISALPAGTAKKPQFLMEANDITQGKLAQQKLIEREASMRNYYEQQPIMMLTLDSHFRIQAINRFATELLGYAEIDLLGHKLNELYVDQDAEPVQSTIADPLQSINGIRKREIRYRHHNNSHLWIRENVRSLSSSGQYLLVGEDITEVHSLTEKLEYQARYDLLTETFNRNHFEIELVQSISEVSDNLRTHAMLYLDLDQLKVLNDTAGHDAGDAAIKFSAMIVESVLPYNSVLSRMGGDEFAVLLRDCTQADAIKIAKLIINGFGSKAFNWDQLTINISCSIGIRLIDHTAESPQMVHAQADTACHAAKDEGRNRFHLYHQDDEELRQRQLEMESVNIVHEALANDRLTLYAQRILPLSEEQQMSTMYFEILVRIQDADNNVISPGIFMPASEKYNIAHLIDKAVVTKTLTWLETNFTRFDELGMCSINLSGQSMGNRAFVDFLLDIIEHSGVPNHKICIEITETAAMGNMKQAIELFSKIKQLGCCIALDDFGSGLSSFGYLKKLPVDIVKIDGLFVRDMDVNETDYIMVRSINDLAKQMGKRTVAEFVENSDIIANLIELGVDYAQGYVISKPKPLNELVEELRSAPM